MGQNNKEDGPLGKGIHVGLMGDAEAGGAVRRAVPPVEESRRIKPSPGANTVKWFQVISVRPSVCW